MEPASLPHRGHGDTRRGRRPHDEDAVLVAPGLGLFAVADGSGAAGSGREASQGALSALVASFSADARAHADAPPVDELGLATGARRLSRAVHSAHAHVLQLARGRSLGTTLVALYLEPERGVAHVAHVGDSRAYRHRGRHLEPLTEDHTLAREVLEAAPGQRLHETPGALTRALGMAGSLRASLRSLPLASGDRFLLCSDGLSEVLDDEQLAAALEQSMRPEALVRLLFEVAGADGGADNAAAVIVDVDRVDPDTSRDAVAPRPRRGRPSVPLRPLGLEALTRWDQGTSLGVGGAPRTDETGPDGGERADPEGADTPGAQGL